MSPDYQDKLRELTSISLFEIHRLIVAGDIHGDYESLKNALAYFDKLSAISKASIIFLGDYADRGHNGLEVVETLRKKSLNNNTIYNYATRNGYNIGRKRCIV